MPPRILLALAVGIELGHLPEFFLQNFITQVDLHFP